MFEGGEDFSLLFALLSAATLLRRSRLLDGARRRERKKRERES